MTPKKKKSLEDLDDELRVYMRSTTQGLNNELDEYMKAREKPAASAPEVVVVV